MMNNQNIKFYKNYPERFKKRKNKGFWKTKITS